MDYRDLDDEFDRIVSVGMFEHVWHKSHRTYMKVVHRCMKDDGLFLLQTVGRNETLSRPDPFIAKYIFPNSLSPSLRRISDAIEGLFVIEDLHNFGVSYDKTLMAWHERFVRSWSEIKQNYDERFFRMWTMFLLSCAGAFRSRYLQLWQVVLSKRGVPGGYLNRLT
jgi:cyclopropane-fatty-acyl-phospholipid synthase